MIDLDTWKKAWALLDVAEKRRAWMVLGVIVVSAFASAVMVGSVMPFIAVMAEPSRIEETPALAWTYSTFGFTSDYQFLVALGLASFIVIVLASLIQILRTWVVAWFSMMRIHSIGHRLLGAYLMQPYTFFLDRHSGEMGQRVLAETEQVVMRFLRFTAEFISSVLTTLAIVALLLWVEPVVAMLAFTVLGGIYLLVYQTSRRRLRQHGEARVEANRGRFRFVNESLSGIKDIKLLGREQYYLDRYAGPSVTMARSQAGITVLSQIPQYALQAVALSGVILLCLLLIDPADTTGENLGEILPIIGVFALAGQRLMPEFSKIYASLAEMQAGAASVNVIYADLVEGKPTNLAARHASNSIGLKNSLEIKGVSFSYSAAKRASLRAVSLDIKAGEKIGIVGGTGAGKTTFADVLLGLLEPAEGSLFVDEVQITRDNVRAWMNSVGYVPQDIFLTDSSVAENIALGFAPETIDRDRLRRAARVARIEDFILQEMPQGYETLIGERGVRLSGGQRQRIGIARALYHDADLIVFDEATSALDNLTERDVMEAIDALPGDKTILIIAHRLSTVRRCDRIVVLEQGQIVGCGSWNALMAENAFFQRIAQVGEPA
jgi:ABC-type bacteriocin/lantibiotic exporter with double-glycine peptidase domain